LRADDIVLHAGPRWRERDARKIEAVKSAAWMHSSLDAFGHLLCSLFASLRVQEIFPADKSIHYPLAELTAIVV
jgi:hypothetical protein